MAALFSSCGEFMGVSSKKDTLVVGTREAGTGFDAGKAISESDSGRYTIEHRLDINPQDGYTESTHYDLAPGH